MELAGEFGDFVFHIRTVGSAKGQDHVPACGGLLDLPRHDGLLRDSFCHAVQYTRLGGTCGERSYAPAGMLPLLEQRGVISEWRSGKTGSEIEVDQKEIACGIF